MKLKSYLFTTLTELEDQRANVDKAMGDYDPDDVWMSVANHLDEEIEWRRDLLIKVLQGEYHPSY